MTSSLQLQRQITLALRQLSNIEMEIVEAIDRRNELAAQVRVLREKQANILDKRYLAEQGAAAVAEVERICGVGG